MEMGHLWLAIPFSCTGYYHYTNLSCKKSAEKSFKSRQTTSLNFLIPQPAKIQNSFLRYLRGDQEDYLNRPRADFKLPNKALKVLALHPL
jgi:hypothetical protein